MIWCLLFKRNCFLVNFASFQVFEQPPKIELKSSNFHEMLEFDEQLDKLTKTTVLIPCAQDVEVKYNQGLTNLDLLSSVIPFTIADAVCDVSYHRAQMADDMEAFGQKGADNVEAFKNNWLKSYHEQGLAAYKLEDPFETSLNECKVTLGFECVIKGYEGKGTDYVYVNNEKLLTKIIAIRH